MSVPRAYGAAAALPDGKVLVTGGSSPGILASAEIYDPALKSSTPLPSPASDMQQPLVRHVAVPLLSGKILIAGGYHGSGVNGQTANAQIFDPASRSFSPVANMSTVREGAIGARLADGRVLVAGGRNTDLGAPLTSAEIYDPSSDTWAPTGSMTTGRTGAAAAPLPDGRILVVGGGNGSSTATSSAEVYNPATGTFTSAGIGSMGIPRAYPAVGGLGNGTILVAGGLSSLTPDFTIEASAEVFNPSTNTFSSSGVGPLGTARYAAASASLPDGRVVLLGGDGPSGPLDSAEVYFEPSPAPPPAGAKCKGKTATIVASSARTVGTARNDVIVGRNRKDKISAKGGKDLVCALGGNDVVKGGGGKDTLLGGRGADTLKGGPGVDKLKGGPGKDLQTKTLGRGST